MSLGRIRRPGIVDIPAVAYDEFCTAVRRHLLTLKGALMAKAAFAAARAGLSAELTRLEQCSADGGPLPSLAALAAAMDKVMAFHTLNWLLPREEAERHLATVLGDPAAARACLLAQAVPAEPAHLLDVHAWLLECTATMDAASFAQHRGHLQHQGLGATPWEDPHQTAELMERLAEAGGERLAEQVTALRASHEAAARRRDGLYAAALLASAGDRGLYERTRAIGVAFGLAADEEEFRKVAQQRFLRTFREACEARNWNAFDLSLDDFLCAVAQEAACSR